METLDAILPHLYAHPYLCVFGLILLFSFLLPVSKTLVIVGAGILASRGIGSLYLYLLVGAAGLVTADGLYFLLGYIGGERVLRWRGFSGPKMRARLREAELRFLQHGRMAVFSARFLPFMRSLVFIVAGASRMPPLRFLYADGLSAALFVPAACLLGFFCAGNRHRLVAHVQEGEWILGVVFVFFVLLVYVLPRRAPRGGG